MQLSHFCHVHHRLFFQQLKSLNKKNSRYFVLVLRGGGKKKAFVDEEQNLEKETP